MERQIQEEVVGIQVAAFVLGACHGRLVAQEVATHDVRYLPSNYALHRQGVNNRDPFDLHTDRNDSVEGLDSGIPEDAIHRSQQSPKKVHGEETGPYGLAYIHQHMAEDRQSDRYNLRPCCQFSESYHLRGNIHLQMIDYVIQCEDVARVDDDFDGGDLDDLQYEMEDDWEDLLHLRLQLHCKLQGCSHYLKALDNPEN